MINNDKRGVELYHEPQEGSTYHNMPALLNGKEAWRHGNMNGGDINAAGSSAHNGLGATADYGGLHNVKTTNWNNNSRNVNQESVIVRNNKPTPAAFDHMRAEVTGMIGLNQLNLSDFKFVSRPLHEHTPVGSVKPNGHKHMNLNDTLSSLSMDSKYPLPSNTTTSSGATSPRYIIDKSARGYSNQTLADTQSLKFHVYPPAVYQPKIEKEPKKANLKFNESKRNVKNQIRQNIIVNGRKKDSTSSTYTESIATAVTSLTAVTPHKVVTIIRPTTSAKKLIKLSRPELVAQYGTGKQSVATDRRPNLPYVKTMPPVRLEPRSDAKARDADSLTGDKNAMSVEAIPQIVSLYSLSDALKRSPEKSPQKAKTARRKKKSLPLDPTKTDAKKPGSNDATRFITTGDQTQIISDPGLRFTHAVSKNKNPVKNKNTRTDTSTNFSISSSSLEAWFKSTQNSALEMQVLKSPPTYSSRPNEWNAPATTASSRDSVITIQEMNPLNPKVFQISLSDLTPLENPSVSASPVSKSNSPKKRHVRSNPKSKVSKTKKRGLSVNDPLQNTSSKSAKISISRQTGKPENVASIITNSGAQLSRDPTAVPKVLHAEDQIENTTSFSDTPLDYSMKTLNKTSQKEEEIQSQPLDLTVSKKQTQPLDQEQAISTTEKDSTGSPVFSKPKPKPDLIMKTIDRVISRSKAYVLLPDQKNLIHRSEIKHGAERVTTSAKTSHGVTSSASTTAGVSVETIPFSNISNDVQKIVPRVSFNSVEVITTTTSVPTLMPSVPCVSVSDAPPDNAEHSQVNDPINTFTDTDVKTLNSKITEVTTDNARKKLISSEIELTQQSAVEIVQDNTNEVTEKLAQKPDDEVPHDVSNTDTLVEVIHENDALTKNIDKDVEKQENLTQVSNAEGDGKILSVVSDMETSMEVEKTPENNTPKINPQLVVKVRKISGGEFKIVHTPDAQKNEEIPNNLESVKIDKLDAEATRDKERVNGTTEESQVEVSIDDFDIIKTIPHRAKPRQDFFELGEACCDEYDNMHFNEEVLEFGECGVKEMFEEKENVNLDLPEDTDKCSDMSNKTEDKVIIDTDYSQESPAKALEPKSCDTVDISKENQPHPPQDLILSFQDQIHHLQPSEAQVPDVHGDIPTIKEEVSENKSPTSLKRKSSIKLGYNVNCDIKSPELIKKRRKLISKDIKPVLKVTKAESSCSIILSDSDASSEELENMFKTLRFKKAKSKRRTKDTHIRKPRISKNATHPVEINMEIVQTSKDMVDSNASVNSRDKISEESGTPKLKKAKRGRPKSSNSVVQTHKDLVSNFSVSSQDKVVKQSSEESETPKLKKASPKRRTKEVNVAEPVEPRNDTHPSLVNMDTVQTDKDTVASDTLDSSPVKLSTNMVSQKPPTEHTVEHTSAMSAENVQIDNVVACKPSISPDKLTDVASQKISTKDANEVDSDEALKKIVDKIIFSTAVKVTSNAVKSKKLGKVSCGESKLVLSTNPEPTQERRLHAVRMGNWRQKMLPVPTRVQIQPLPCYHKEKIQKKNISQYKNLMILQDLVKLGALMNESIKFVPKATEYISYPSVLPDEFQGKSSIHITEGIKLRQCFVRLEKLNI